MQSEVATREASWASLDSMWLVEPVDVAQPRRERALSGATAADESSPLAGGRAACGESGQERSRHSAGPAHVSVSDVMGRLLSEEGVGLETGASARRCLQCGVVEAELICLACMFSKENARAEPKRLSVHRTLGPEARLEARHARADGSRTNFGVANELVKARRRRAEPPARAFRDQMILDACASDMVDVSSRVGRSRFRESAKSHRRRQRESAPIGPRKRLIGNDSAWLLPGLHHIRDADL
uniref:Uncharacterized protein n=1 Tax=Erythrolobus australicus TaxID=1077150 RepID=A0A7S1XG75_9RHOD